MKSDRVLIRRRVRLIERLILHEENLLAQRLIIFLLLNSILAAALMYSVKIQLLWSLWFPHAVGALGIFFCLIMFPHFWRVKKTLEFYHLEAQKLEKDFHDLYRRREIYLGGYGQFTRWLRGDNTGFIFGALFLGFWVFSLIRVITT